MSAHRPTGLPGLVESVLWGLAGLAVGLLFSIVLPWGFAGPLLP